MAGIFRDCGIDLTDGQLDLFWQYHRLLRARNEEGDLTRLHNFEKMVLLHYVDCALVALKTDLPSPLLDIGTGAGLPGIPLKIMRPDVELILAESRHKKLDFLDEVRESLGLGGVELYPHKVTERFDGRVNGVITRDLEGLTRTLERAAGFLPRGGRVIVMKGPSVDEELAAAPPEFNASFPLAEDHAYAIGRTTHRRRLLVFERKGGPVFDVPEKARHAAAVREIASARNKVYKSFLKALDTRGVKKQGQAVFSGMRQVREVLSDFPGVVEAVLVTGADEVPSNVPPGAALYALRPELFRELDVFGAGPPLLVVRVPEIPVWNEGMDPAGCTLFTPFQDPANIGAVIRSAAAFGVARVVLLAEAAHPFHPRSLRAAGPTVFRVPLASGPPLGDLKTREMPVIALSARGSELAGYPFPAQFGLVPGLEGPGLPDDFPASDRLAVPMQPGVESLNAATATAVVLYEWRRGRSG